MDFVTSKIDFLAKFFLNNSPEDLSIQDTTDYASTGGSVAGQYTKTPVATSQVEIVFDAILPNGNIFYDGDDSFTTPDIDRDVTDTKSGVVIQKDASGNLLTGDYQVDYKLKVTDETIQLHSFQSSQIDTNTLQVRIVGDWRSWFNTASSIAITGSTASDDSYTLSTVSYDGTNTIAQLTKGTPGSVPATPDQVLDIDLVATFTYTTNKKFNFNYEATEGCIVMSLDCDKSEIRSEDKTDYSQYDGNAPLSSQRNHTLRYPVDLVPPQSDVTSQNAIISVNPAYTNTWTATIAAVVEITQADGLIVQDTINATESLDAQCDDQWCTMFSCLENVQKNYDEAVTNNNQSELERWDVAYQKVQGYHMLWRIARSCGDSEAAAKYTELTMEVLNSEDCCSVDTKAKSEPSKLIQAITDGGLTTIYNELVNQWFTGVGVPSPAIHDDGDLYLDVSGQGVSGNGDIYLKVSGSWVLQTNIAGTDGADGTNGTDGVDGTNGADGLRGSQIYAEDKPISDPPGAADGDFNIAPDATISRRDGGSWSDYADPRGVEIFAENGLPSDSLGKDGDISIDPTTAEYYKKTGGSWAAFTSGRGADGIGALFVDTSRVLSTSLLPPPTNGNWSIIKEYEIGADVVKDGEEICVKAYLSRNNGTIGDGDAVRIRIGPSAGVTHTYQFATDEANVEMSVNFNWLPGSTNRTFTFSSEAKANLTTNNNSLLVPGLPSNIYNKVGIQATGIDPENQAYKIYVEVFSNDFATNVFTCDLFQVTRTKLFP